jgi:transcriptional regulator with XRE-family HTH domain
VDKDNPKRGHRARGHPLLVVAMAVTESDRAFGARLREAREKKGWSMREASEHSGIPTSTLGNYETGVRPLPLRAAKLLADLYGLDVASNGSTPAATFADGVRWGYVANARKYLRDALELIDLAIPASAEMALGKGNEPPPTEANPPPKPEPVTGAHVQVAETIVPRKPVAKKRVKKGKR